jgi:hypothetical protein
MTRRTAARGVLDRETSGTVDFDAALEGYIQGGNREELLRAAGKVFDCNLRIDPKYADTISELIDNLDIEIETYADAAHAIRRWFAAMEEPGARH